MRRNKNRAAAKTQQVPSSSPPDPAKNTLDDNAVAKSEVELVMRMWLATNFRAGSLSGFEHWVDNRDGELYHATSANVSGISMLPKGCNMTLEFFCNNTYVELKALVWTLQLCGCRDVTEVKDYKDLLSTLPSERTTPPPARRVASSCGLRTQRLSADHLGRSPEVTSFVSNVPANENQQVAPGLR